MNISLLRALHLAARPLIVHLFFKILYFSLVDLPVISSRICCISGKYIALSLTAARVFFSSYFFCLLEESIFLVLFNNRMNLSFTKFNNR